MTYWLEVTRRALLGTHAARFPTFAAFSDWGLIGVLALMTALLAGVGVGVQRGAAPLQRRELIDIETNFWSNNHLGG